MTKLLFAIAAISFLATTIPAKAHCPPVQAGTATREGVLVGSLSRERPS
jgi:hypothetical protein